MSYRTILMASAAIMMSATGSARAAESATVAFLMPDQASTRYEQHDYRRVCRGVQSVRHSVSHGRQARGRGRSAAIHVRGRYGE